MRGRVVALLAGALIVVLGVLLVVVLRQPSPDVEGLAAVGDRPFGKGDTIRAGATAAILNDDATRLALLTDDGLGLAEDGRVRAVTAPGSRVVDVAWFPNGATLLVAEGPTPTGGLAVVDIDGTVRGTIPLEPSVGFGTGHGMAVAPGGRRAVVTAVERPPLGGERRHLVLVDLETGATRALTDPAPAPEETGPYFLAADRVAFTEVGADGSTRPRIIDVTDGVTTAAGEAGTVVGVAPPAVLLLEGREVTAVAASPASGRPRQRLGEIPEGTALSSVDGRRGQAVVLDRGGRVRRVPIARVGAPA